MGLLGLWMVAAALFASALVFGWVTITAQPMAEHLHRRSRPRTQDTLVRQACANLDDEYRNCSSADP